MKRMHIHIGVDDLAQSIAFYNALFGEEPNKTKTDYAKWMLDDPAINFAISTRAGKRGVDHLGIQVSEEGELSELRERLQRADMSVFDEGETVCCYARSDKSWLEDPAGIPWEAYQSMADVELFSAAGDEASAGGACCAPASQTAATASVSVENSGACCG